MKLWEKGDKLDPLIERFTVGNDYALDQRLVKYDCLASKAHARMLGKIGVLTRTEVDDLTAALDEIAALDAAGEFPISAQDEDCHTAIEGFLTCKLGDTGKKIHTGRSRNDQVLTALRLYEKDELNEISALLGDYAKALGAVIDGQGEIEMPGYTHMQRAMPTTVAVWLGSFQAAAEVNAALIASALEIIDQCPLGTAAGFGVPVLTVDREMTRELLGFGAVMENPMMAQLSRGKFEAILLGACTQIAFDLNKLASDLLLFCTSEFAMVRLPARVCTGSSIMPQKRNPDVLELLRAKYHVVLAEELKTKSLMGNLVSGYNRDLQLTKESLFCGIDTVKQCLKVVCVVLDGLCIDERACKDALTDEVWATHKALELVKKGIPFREAYRIAASKRDDES